MLWNPIQIDKVNSLHRDDVLLTTQDFYSLYMFEIIFSFDSLIVIISIHITDRFNWYCMKERKNSTVDEVLRYKKMRIGYWAIRIVWMFENISSMHTMYSEQSKNTVFNEFNWNGECHFWITVQLITPLKLFN